MTESTGPPDQPAPLRQRAETQVGAKQAQPAGELSPEAARALVHELQVHQIELQLQNEELRRAQVELEVVRARYFELYDLAPVGYFTLSAPGLIQEANLTAAQLLGVDRAALPETPLSRFVLPEDGDSYYLFLRHLVTSGRPQQCEVQLQRAGAMPFWGKLQATMAPDPEGVPGYRVILSDVTKRKRLEQELIQTQRLRAVGELSAGICHNLNNLLTGVLAPADLLRMTSKDPKVQRLSEMVVEAGTRAAELVHRLHLSVRQRGTAAVTAVAVNPMIEGMVRMTRGRWQDESEARGRTIEVRTALAAVPPIKGDPSEIHDLLTNLLFNAVDALPEGGLITIETAREGDLVRLDFSDNGTGMDEATRVRVFEPFFTTKTDVGSGLGLSTLYNSVTQWGGTVVVASTPGKGTTFTLRLPVWQEAVAAAPTPGAVLDSRPGRLLIVEDDPVIGRILKEVLSIRHQVEVFTTGQEALAQFSAGKYDVAIFDLGLPGIPGDQVAQRMLAVDPAMGRILFSGWTLEEDDPRSKLFDLTLQKPLRDLRVFEQIVAQAIVLRDQRAGSA